MIPVTLVMDTLTVGGAEQALANMLASLDRARFRPSVICLRSAGPLAAEYRSRGIPVEVLGRRGPSHWGTITVLVARLRALGTRVVLLFSHQAPLVFGRIAARRVGAATVVAVHGMDGLEDGEPNIPRFARHTSPLTDVVVVLAQSQLNYMREREGFGNGRLSTNRVVEIPNGVRLPDAPNPARRTHARSALGLASDAVVVGIVAALRPEKAHELLIGAFAAAGAARSNLHLAIVGGGEREAQLRDLASTTGVHDRIHFLGTRHDVGDLLPGFDIFCLTSRREALPLSILEAMGAGLPIVSTDVGAIRDVVRDATDGFLVPNGDQRTLAERIGQLADDEALRQRMGSHGRARVAEHFTIETVVRRYEELFTELSGARR